MRQLSGIVATGPDEATVEGQSRPIFEVRGKCSIVTIGLDCDPLCVESAIHEACALRRPMVLRINSGGGVLDDVAECLVPAIRRAVVECRLVAAFLEVCHGAAYLAAVECAPIVASRSATIGHFGVRVTSRAWGSECVVAASQEQVWNRIRERRPRVTREILARFADRSMSSEQAEAYGLIDGIATLPRVVAGHI